MFRTLFGSEEEWSEMSSWMNKIYPEDLAATAHVWHDLTVSGKIVDFEYRIKKTWTHPTLKEICLPYTWCVANAYPAIAEDGTTEYVTTVIDISLQKWIQRESQTRAEELLEAKRQQVMPSMLTQFR